MPCPLAPMPGCVEALESRQLFAIPTHLALAERSVAEIAPENNVYANGPSTVTWAGINGATLTTNKSDCTTYVTRVLKQAYGYTDAQFASWLGSSSPSLTRYYDSAVGDTALDGFKQISELQPGDLFISKYPEGSTALGHMVIADAAPVYVKTTATNIVYNLTIIDVTGSPHSSDTRSVIDPSTGVHDTGVGRGNIRLYTDLNGNLSYWAWGTASTSSTYSPTDRPATFAHLMSAAFVNTPAAPTGFTASLSGATNVNLAWVDNATNETSYILERSTDGGAYTRLAALVANAKSWTSTSGTPGHVYQYRLYAVNGNYSSAKVISPYVKTPPQTGGLKPAPTRSFAIAGPVRHRTVTQDLLNAAVL